MVSFRDTTKGKRVADFLVQRVWLWNGKESKNRCFTLLVRRESGKPDCIKYTLTNAGSDTTLERLAFMQGQRYFVERSFQNAKSYLGMGQYQVDRLRGLTRHRRPA